MKNSKFNRGFVLSLVLCILLSIPINGQATTVQDSYSSGINVGLTSMGDVLTLDFIVNNDYLILNQPTMLKINNKYNLSINGGILTLKENGSIIFTTNQDLVLKPANEGALITFNKKSYLGSMKFKIRNPQAFYSINTLKIEDYLIGVLPYEMGDSFPIEALKAQAVAARTYALYHKNTGEYDVRDDTGSQVYNGYDAANKNSVTAINATKGEILTYNGNIIEAVFSASNGGYTEAANNVWASSYPYLIDRKDDFDAVDSSYKCFSKIVNYTDTDLDGIIKKHLTAHADWNYVKFIKIDITGIKTFPSGRISSLPILFVDKDNVTQTKYITKEEARTFFSLPSAMYTVTLSQNNITMENTYKFDVKGYGHGVGLSQWGAYYRALSKTNPQNYKDILNFYYYNTAIQNVNNGEKAIQFDSYVGDINRYSTSISIANKAFNPSSSGKIQNVVIATGNSFPDALSGSVLAKKYNAPILLVEKEPDSENSLKILDYINNNVEKTGKVYMLGGVGTISSNFEAKFKQLGFNNIIRLGGKDRIETSNLINNEINTVDNTPIVIATAKDFPDALSISPIAAANGWPIFLVDKTVETNLKNYLTTKKPSKVYIVGEVGVVSDNIKNGIKTILNYGDDKVIRLGGSNRYETSKVINLNFIQKSDKVILATGVGFPDALAGSVYAGLNNYPIVLADSSNTISAVSYLKFLSNNGNIVHLEALGLQGAVDQSTINFLITPVK